MYICIKYINEYMHIIYIYIYIIYYVCMYACMFLIPNVTNPPINRYYRIFATGSFGHTHVQLCTWMHICAVLYVNRINTNVKMQNQVDKGSFLS